MGVCGRRWGVEKGETKDCSSGRLSGIIDGALQARKDPPRTHWMKLLLNVTLCDGIRLSGRRRRRRCRFTRRLGGDDEEDELLSFHCELSLSALQAVNFRTARQHWTTAAVAERGGWSCGGGLVGTSAPLQGTEPTSTKETTSPFFFLSFNEYCTGRDLLEYSTVGLFSFVPSEQL